MLGGLGTIHGVRCVTLPGNPRPKARPRFTRTGKPYVLSEERKAETRIRGILKESGIRCSSGPLLVACLFIRSDRRLVDADNLEKFAWDAAQGVLWANDHQIIGHAALIGYSSTRPRTVVALVDADRKG